MSRQRALWMIGLVSAGLLLFSARTFAVQQLGYRVVVADGNFEVRDYPSAMAAEAVRKGSRNSSVNSAFRILADYIFAKNRVGPKIAMTAPVTQTPQEAVRASSGPAADVGGWRVRFLMPHGSTLDSLPVPEGDIRLVELAPMRVAAVRFTGRWTDANFTAATASLRAWMAEKNLETIGPPTFAYYDPPFKPWFLRRNEVLIPVAH